MSSRSIMQCPQNWPLVYRPQAAQGYFPSATFAAHCERSLWRSRTQLSHPQSMYRSVQAVSSWRSKWRPQLRQQTSEVWALVVSQSIVCIGQGTKHDYLKVVSTGPMVRPKRPVEARFPQLSCGLPMEGVDINIVNATHTDFVLVSFCVSLLRRNE